MKTEPSAKPDATAGARVARARRSAAGKISDVLLDKSENAALSWLLRQSGETKAALVRRLIIEEAARGKAAKRRPQDGGAAEPADQERDAGSSGTGGGNAVLSGGVSIPH